MRIEVLIVIVMLFGCTQTANVDSVDKPKDVMLINTRNLPCGEEIIFNFPSNDAIGCLVDKCPVYLHLNFAGENCSVLARGGVYLDDVELMGYTGEEIVLEKIC